MLSWERADEDKVELFLTFSDVPNLGFFLLQQHALMSPPLNSWTPTKALLSIGDCLSQCSTGFLDRGQEGLKPVHGPLQDP